MHSQQNAHGACAAIGKIIATNKHAQHRPTKNLGQILPWHL